MGEGSLDAAGQRELARLISEEGLSPAQAAARLGIPEPAARAYVAGWHAATLASAAPRRSFTGRRQLAGVAFVLAFVPVGWVLSAALFGDDDAGRDGATSVSGAPVTGGSTHFTAAAARSRKLPPGTSLAARVKADRVQVYARRGGGRHRTLRARRLNGRRLPLVMLVNRRKPGWLRVQLPTRPNHATGWVRAGAVRLHTVEWRLRIDLGTRKVTTWRGTRKISVHPIGVGRAVTPTPRGRYYLTDLVKPPDPNGLYGAYAFGLSAHSNVLTSFGAGDGQIGLHGTNAPSKLGTEVSHGCIRVDNSVIESFARHLPLGTPVRITS